MISKEQMKQFGGKWVALEPVARDKNGFFIVVASADTLEGLRYIQSNRDFVILRCPYPEGLCVNCGHEGYRRISHRPGTYGDWMCVLYTRHVGKEPREPTDRTTGASRDL